MKKTTIVLTLCLFLSVFVGCAQKEQVMSTDDPIEDYDTVEDVRVDGENGGFTVKTKLYKSEDYSTSTNRKTANPYVYCGDILVMKVENNIGRDCSIMIQGTYFKSDKTKIKTEDKRFFGFSENDSNYFFFKPSIDFDSFSYKLSLLEDDMPGLSKNWSFGTVATAKPSVTTNPEGVKNNAILNFSEKCTSPETMYIKLEMLFFDNMGNPFLVTTYTGGANDNMGTIAEAVCVEKDGKYVLPDNLKGDLGCVISIVEILNQEQWEKLISG